jgi:hypothetical protein
MNINLHMRYPESRQEDITDAFTRGYIEAVEASNNAIKKLEAENAKLRELARDVALIAYCSGSKVLDMQVWAKNADHRTIAERMRELGVYGEEL